MSDLVIIEENKACTTSLAIADGTNNEHRAVLQLIKNHRSSLSEFGGVSFKMRPFETKGGTQVQRVAVLNEGQATLLMTLLRNSPRVVEFKVALVKAFFKARDLLMTGQMGLLQKHAILTLALGDEKEIASSCGKGLSDWKRKRDGLEAAIQSIERQIQPQLTNFE